MYLKAKQPNPLKLGPMLLLGMLSTGVWANTAPNEVNMPVGVTEIGEKIYDLHMLIFWICVVTGIIVFGFLFYSIFAYRKSNGHEPATFHHNTKAELAWTIIPAIILFGMAVPASQTLIDIYDTSDSDLDVLVTGYQWKWKYEYVPGDYIPDGPKVSYFSNLRTPREEINNEEEKGQFYLLEVDEPLVLPVNKKTRFLITANDVIHAWWVPELAVKKDAIPGFINEKAAIPTKEGVYRGQCAELCGKDHGFMPIVVNVVSDEEFSEWFAAKQEVAAEAEAAKNLELTMDEALAMGKEVYDASCAACHGANGEGGVGTAIAGSAIATGDINKHLDIGINGVPGTAMQAFGNQLGYDQLAAVITYQRNAFGNNMGDMVQPIDVYNAKTGN